MGLESQSPDLILTTSGGVKEQTSYSETTREENIEGTMVVICTTQRASLSCGEGSLTVCWAQEVIKRQ